MALANKTESRNFSASSVINDTVVMYMNSSYSSTGDLNFNQSIHDMELYQANKTIVDNDYETWKDEVYNKIFG